MPNLLLFLKKMFTQALSCIESFLMLVPTVMRNFCFLIFGFIFLTSLSYCNDLNIKSVRLKNGASIFYSEENWGGGAVPIHIFIKNGSTLKFKNKTGLVSLSRDILKKQLSHLAKKKGFRFKTWLDWDYLSITLYLSGEIKTLDLDEIFFLIFGNKKITINELEISKNSIFEQAKNSIAKRKYIEYPLLSFMVHHSSIYSRGFIGNTEDIKSVTLDEIEDFMSTYYTINNARISVSGKKNFSKLKSVALSLKPVFKSTEYSVEKFATLDLPKKIVVHVKSEKKYDFVRIGFPSSACNPRKNAIYDILAQIITSDTEIRSLAKYVYAENNCSKGLGFFELSLSNPISKDNSDLSVSKVFLRLSDLSSNIEELQINLAKQNLEKKYKNLLNRRDDSFYVFSKSLALCEDKRCFTEYLYNLNNVRVEDIKRALHGFSEERSCKIFVKMEL
jgi:predicted Zn-dependent peptidase